MIPHRWVVILILVTGQAAMAQKSTYAGSSNSSSSQDSGGSGGQSNGGGKGGKGEGDVSGGGSGGAGGFSIEAEMLAYKTLESDSEAIACDVAVYIVFNNPANSPEPFAPAGDEQGRVDSEDGSQRWEPLKQVCGSWVGNNFSPIGAVGLDDQRKRQEAPGVVILSSADPTLADIQAWRLDMAIIAVLRRRSAAYLDACPNAAAPSGEQQGETNKSFGFLSAASEGVSLIQSIAQLFATNESTSGVQGTIQDQALIDGIARQFRVIGIPTLVPSLYGSFGLDASYDPKSGLQITHSPFLNNLSLLIDDRVCLAGQVQGITAAVAANTRALNATNAKIAQAQKKDPNADVTADTGTVQDLMAQNQALQAKLADMSGIVVSIDSFVASLLGGSVQSQAAQQQGADQGNSDSQSAGQKQSKTTGQNTQSQGQNSGQSSQSSPINAILSADGIIRRLNLGATDDLYRWHVLSVKALESGGGVLTRSSIFGSKLFFSGGAVATYALFQVNGALNCSGNVYDYDGYIREKDFAKEFRKPDITPNQQMIFYRGRCSLVESATKP